MPAILIQILRMLAGLGAGGLASFGATKHLAPKIGQAVGKIAPKLAGGFGGKVGEVGTGALGLGAGIAGFGAGDLATEFALNTLGGEPPQDDTVDNVLRLTNQGFPLQQEQQQGLQRVFEEAEVRAALEAMGIDFDDFSELAGSRQLGGLV